MPARRAPQLNPVILEVEHFVVAAQSAHPLAQQGQEPVEQAGGQRSKAAGSKRPHRESVGVVRDHRLAPLRL
jgi:hypothetical protein